MKLQRSQLPLFWNLVALVKCESFSSSYFTKRFKQTCHYFDSQTSTFFISATLGFGLHSSHLCVKKSLQSSCLAVADPRSIFVPSCSFATVDHLNHRLHRLSLLLRALHLQICQNFALPARRAVPQPGRTEFFCSARRAQLAACTSRTHHPLSCPSKQQQRWPQRRWWTGRGS